MNRFVHTRSYVLFFAFWIVFGIATAEGQQPTESPPGKPQEASVDSKPVLKLARLETLDFDYSSLHFKIDGEYRDMAGLRVKEHHVDVNGTTFTIEEDYPVWIDSPPIYSPSWQDSSINVHFRQYKNEKQWKRYLEDIQMRRELASKNKEAQDAGEPVFDIETERMEIPPVWLSVPEPNKVRVFVSVYDCAGNESKAVEIEDVLDCFISPEDMDKFSRDSTEYYDPSTDSELATYTADSPMDVDNAALLYYQAFLSRPKRDSRTGLIMNRVLRGAEPDGNIRRYLKDCRQTIKLTKAAGLIRDCNWGISSSQRLGNMRLADLRDLSIILDLYTRTLATDGHYREALDSSLAIRRLARHVGDESVLLYLFSRQIDSMALRTIRHILGIIPPDTDTMILFRGQLAAAQGIPNSFTAAMEYQFERALHILRNNPNNYKLWRRDLAILAGLPYDENETKDLPKILVKEASELKENWKDLRVTDREKDEVQMLLNMTDEELLERSRQSYEKWLNSFFRILESDISYQKKYAELQRLEGELRGEPDDPNSILYHFDPDNVFMIHIYSEPTRLYGMQIRHRAELSALMTAIEIYRIKAQTGRLPDSLPADLSKDPFSGEDFRYEITDEGFALHCRARDLEASPKEFRPGKLPKILSDKFQQYEFKVKK